MLGYRKNKMCQHPHFIFGFGLVHFFFERDSCISIYKVLTHFGALVGYKSNTLFLTVTTALNKVSFLPTTPAFCSWRLEKCIA